MAKIYLKTPEAVIKALKDGKEVRDKYGSICKLVDGIIISKLNDFFEIGKPIRSVNKPYILEEEPLKIKVGKWYETSGHQKARCFIVEKERCHFTIDNNCHFFTNKNGIYVDNEMSRYNIIGPWEE